jgi:hypothetical protein
MEEVVDCMKPHLASSLFSRARFAFSFARWSSFCCFRSDADKRAEEEEEWREKAEELREREREKGDSCCW